MSWNYRVFKQIDEYSGDAWYSIVEAYYDADGKPDGYTDPIPCTGSSIEDLRWVLEKMLKALDEPVLIEEDFKTDDRS